MKNDKIMLNYLSHVIEPSEKDNIFFELCNHLTFYKGELPFVTLKTQAKALYIINKVGFSGAEKIINLINKE
jgi:hypothetical protein